MSEPWGKCHRCGKEWAEEKDMDPFHFMSCPNVPPATTKLLDHIMSGGSIGRLPNWEEVYKDLPAGIWGKSS